MMIRGRSKHVDTQSVLYSTSQISDQISRLLQGFPGVCFDTKCTTGCVKEKCGNVAQCKQCIEFGKNCQQCGQECQGCQKPCQNCFMMTKMVGGEKQWRKEGWKTKPDQWSEKPIDASKLEHFEKMRRVVDYQKEQYEGKDRGMMNDDAWWMEDEIKSASTKSLAGYLDCRLCTPSVISMVERVLQQIWPGRILIGEEEVIRIKSRKFTAEW